MKTLPLLLLFRILAFSPACCCQNTQALHQHFQKYFLSLPYNKPVSTWLNEIADSKMVALDKPHSEDSASGIVLRGYINNWTLFETLDSIKFYVGRRISKQTFGVNENPVGTGFDTSLYLQEIFYFPYQKVDKNKWKEIYKPVLKGFEQGLHSVRPNGGPRQGELVWFTATSGLPFGGPMVSMEWGKIEARGLYFITLILYFKANNDE